MRPDAPTSGSLFTGAAGLDLAVGARFGASLQWVAEYQPPTKQEPKPTQAAARLLAAHYPDVPNLGDVSAIDWRSVCPVDVITGGFPCQDLSLAGNRAGLQRGANRSGMWQYMHHAVEALRPKAVVIENVRGLLSAEADGYLEPCPLCVGDESAGALRALGAVLGDLADLGYDACWTGLRAADVGAAHGRYRIFILAWPEGGQQWIADHYRAAA